MSSLKTIENKIHQLSPDLVAKVENYVDSLLAQNKQKEQHKYLKQDWGGGLKDFKNKYTSLELQKRALEWRTK